jgi:hypothetical protein
VPSLSQKDTVSFSANDCTAERKHERKGLVREIAELKAE